MAHGAAFTFLTVFNGEPKMSGAKLELRGRADTSAPRPAPPCTLDAPGFTPTQAAEAKVRRKCLYLLQPVYLRPTASEHTSCGMCVCVCFFLHNTTQHNTTNDYTTVKKPQERSVGCVRCNKLCVFIHRLYLLPVKKDLQLLMQSDCFLFSSSLARARVSVLFSVL